MKNCCKSGPKNKQCVRRSNKKVFSLPRKFSYEFKYLSSP